MAYLYSFIIDRQTIKHSGIKGIKRTRYLLKQLGNPQEKLHVIHVAGTSGKGSTCYLINILLRVHGFKVGLQVSPHLLDIRERFQINNQLVNQGELIKIFKDIKPLVEKCRSSKWGRLTFFEILVAFTFYFFAKQKVDFVVMETGLGGLYDGTNVVENPNKIAVITRIGLDHQWILGRTYHAIAQQKAGIVHKGNILITIKQKSTVLSVFKKTCQEKDARFIQLKPIVNFKNIEVSKINTSFDFSYQSLILTKLNLGLLGKHQAENTSLALTTLYELSRKYKFFIKQEAIRKVLITSHFKGRGEICKINGREIIIDGAHNPQKMKALINFLKLTYPKEKFTVIMAFSRGKKQVATIRTMLKQLIPIANKIFLTNFHLEGQDFVHQAVAPEFIKKILKRLNYFSYQIIHDQQQSFHEAIVRESCPILVTGSLYLISSFYKQKILKT